LADWRDKIRNPNCELCPLHEEAEHVCLLGAGTRKAKIFIVGEAPGAREDEEHEAFVGPAGQLLDQTLHAAGLSRRDCYITNAAKCRPPDNRTPTRGEAKACSSTYLARELQKVRAPHILLLGNTALQAVVGRSGITKYRGKTWEVGEGRIALATFHPAAVLRNPRYGNELRADVSRLGRMVRGESDGIKTKTKLISTKGQLRALRDKLLTTPINSFDIETNGLQEWVPGAAIVSISFSFKPGQAYVVPLWHKQSPWRKPWQKVLLYLKKGLERLDCKYIAHNGKFDCRWLAWFGVFVLLTFDTMLAAHMLDENRPKALETLSQVLLGADSWKIDISDAYNIPIRKLAVYNGRDTDNTLRLYYVLKAQLKQEPRIARVFAKLMMPASNALTRVEAVGLYADQKRIEARLNQATLKRDLIMKALITKHKAPEDINFNSPQQLGAWLFGKLKLPVLEETRTGNASTREAVLLKLARQHPAPKLIIEYRLWTKRINTYLEPWLEAARADKRSRIHTNYKLFGTVTGRLSSEGPNLQQVPREPFMRTCLGAPAGWKFVEADFSQVELRIAAMLAGERRMLRAFSTGADIHLQTASEQTGKNPEDITKEERKKAKSYNFALIYDVGAQTLQDYVWEKFGIEISLEEAETAKRKFFTSYPSFIPWHQRQRRLAHRYQRVSSSIGRVRHLPDVLSGSREVVAEAERQAINSPVSSLASDLMLLALTRLSSSLPARDARVVGTVHDAILFEVREVALHTVLPTIKSTMEDLSMVKRKFGAEITVPIEAEVKVGQWWGDPKAEVWG
jgi:uracil-DNA glycosylase family 4